MTAEIALPRVLADLPLAPTIAAALQNHVELVPWHSTEAENIQAIYTYGHPLVDARLLEKLPQVRVISNFGVGVDHIDVRAASARSIAVGNTPGVLDGATADMAFALLLAAARRVVEGDRYARSPEFTHYDPSFMIGREVHGSTLGIIGMGRIGTQVARRARAFDMTILYHNRHRRPDAEASVEARFVSQDELLSAADFVLLTVPLTPATHGLIGQKELARMKRDAILINVARGPVVDIPALTEALTYHAIYAAALDVTAPEPLPRDHPLLRLANVIITPHLGSASDQTRRHMGEMSIDNLLAGLAGRHLPYPVAP